MKKFWLLRGLKIVAFVILAVSAIGFVVMSLWNWLVPALFHGPVINFCQALGILILSKILFGGFHKGGHHHCHKCGHHRGMDWKERWKDKWRDKFSHMSAEDREKIKQKFRNRCGSNWFGEDDNKDKKEDTVKE